MNLGALWGYWYGRLRCLSPLRGVRVFCYHGVVERVTDPRLERFFHPLDSFRAHAAYLRRFRVLPLEALADELERPGEPRRPSAVLTFDDGYANNLLAAEVLDAARLPWSVFVTTGAVAGGPPLWSSELSLLLLHGRAARVEAFGQAHPLESCEQRERAFQSIRFPLKRMTAPERRRALDGLRAQFPEGETARLVEQFPSFRMLGWGQIGQLAAAGVEVESHGVDHELHHGGQPTEVRHRELRESKDELERRLGRPIRFFAYPSGAYCAESPGELEAAGYRAAVTTEPATVLPGADRYLLPRLPAPVNLDRFVQTFHWEPKRRTER